MTILHGDCRDLLREMPDASIDSIVTDPPYGLEFMGKDWDAPWQVSSKSALFGKRDTTVPGFGSQRNATCLTCKGRLRGKTRCGCEVPQWDEAPSATNNRQMLGFQDWFYDIAVECLRVLKPGGHLLAFGGTRTYHRMAVAIEDAGFEVRDSIHWLYGSGFPKSLDVSKAIDRAAGAEREPGEPGRYSARRPRTEVRALNTYQDGVGDYSSSLVTMPATEAARQWDGWGTALKPAHEPIVLARKPLDGTVAANVLRWGTGALNVDGARVATADGRPAYAYPNGAGGSRFKFDDAPNRPDAVEGSTPGRWPANIVLTHAADCADDCAPGCPVQVLDQQSGVSKPKAERMGPMGGSRDGLGMGRGGHAIGTWPGDNGGGASRFFTVTEWGELDVPFRYVAKPSKRERNAGLDRLPERAVHRLGAGIGEGLDPHAPAVDRNHHPTVKPVALMRWLVRLITPPGGTVLDPFLGSGTTAVAATLEGFDWIGCEMTAEYLPIIEGRVAHARGYSPAVAAKVAAVGDEVVRQLDLFGGEAA